MDKLRELLNQKKAQMGNQKVVKRGDIEKEKAEKYYEEQKELEKKKQEKEQKKMEELEEYYKSTQKKLQPNPATSNETNLLNQPADKVDGAAADSTNTAEGEVIEKEPPIAKKEIIKKLRAHKAPITLFGETNWMRYERLCKLEKESVDHEKHEEHSNVFQKDLQLNEDEFSKMIDILDEEIPYEQLVERLEKNKKSLDSNNMEYKGRKKVSISDGVSKDDKCDDVMYWCKKVLKDWEKELEGQGHFTGTSTESKNIIGQYRQCRRHIKPLYLLLRNRDVNEEILDALYHIIHFCLIKEYVKAHDKYLEIAIGNAPWPMGVTMVGIHERSGRTKIFSSQIAHILNDETQRKYLQAIKRLMTVKQKQEPADYSRNVNM